MFGVLRSPTIFHASSRITSGSIGVRNFSLSKLTLIGRLAGDPEIRTTKNEKEYVAYTVATSSFPPPPVGPDGTRPESTTSFHRIFSFADTANNYLKTLKKGALVYVEASFELRDAVTEAGQPPASKQVFCRHETLRLLKHAMHKGDSEEVSGQP